MVRFAIDERSVDLNGLDVADARSAFLTFLERIREVVAEGHGICYDEDLFLSDLRGGATFWDLFSQEPSFSSIMRTASALSPRSARCRNGMNLIHRNRWTSKCGSPAVRSKLQDLSPGPTRRADAVC